MHAGLDDTDAAAAAFQLELFRNASVAKRASLAAALSSATIALSRRALRRAHPHATDNELSCLWVSLHYGPDLAEQLKAHLDARR
jgi:hypothetical protein